MDDIVDQSVLGNALQRISELERLAQHQLNVEPSRPEAVNQTNTANAVEELYQRFPSLRRPSLCQPSVAASTSTSRRSLSSTRSTSSSTTCTTPPTSAMTRSTSGTRTLRNPNSRQNRSRSVNTNGSKTKVALRDLVLMPDPGETAVPTHTRRVLLDSQGFVIHSFPFVRQWDGRTLKRKIEEAFPNHSLLIFEYMKASYGKLIKPNLAPGVVIDGNLLLKLSGQGSVYIRSLEPLLNTDQESTALDDWLDQCELPPSPMIMQCEPPQLQTTVNLLQTSSPTDEMPLVPTVLFSPELSPEVEGALDVDRNNSSCGDRHSTVNIDSDACMVADQPPDLMNETDKPVRDIVVHRANILKDVIEEFKDPTILETTQTYNVVIIDDHGRVEAGRGTGVTREVVSLFWNQFYPSLSAGANRKIPSIRHDYQKPDWEAIARFIVFGYLNTHYFPITLSPVFVADCLFGEESISKDFILNSFYEFVSNDEAETLKKASSSDFDLNDDELLDVLSSYKCHNLPTKDNISLIISQLAHQELVQKPRFISNSMAPLLKQLKDSSQFSSIANLMSFYESKRPTPKKVVKLFVGTASNDAQRQTFDHLKRFVKSLSDETLRLFLQFSTGSDLLVVECITINFTTITGAARRPVAHTCGPVLEMPSTYQSFNELVEEFSSILSNKESWSFDIV